MEILDDVVIYLGDEVAEKDLSVLFILIQRAIRKVYAKRYPFGYTGTEKETTAERYRGTIFSVTVYYWAKQGADGESPHSENGISRAYEKKDDTYFDVVPIAKIIQIAWDSTRLK